MYDIRRTTRREKAFRAWGGDSAELERLAIALQDLLDRRVKILGETNLRDPEVVLTYQDGPDEVSGPWRQILPEMDTRTVSEFRIEAAVEVVGIDEEHARLEFSRKPFTDAPGKAVRLQVVSSDQGWARQAFVALQEELEKGIPPWSLVHTRVGSVVFGWVMFVSTVFVLGRLIGILPGKTESGPGELTAKGWVLSLTIGGVAAFLLAKSDVVREWFFPRLEIVRNDSSRVATRRLALLGTIFVEFAIGVTVNLIT